MKVSQVRVAMFENAAIATLMADINKFLNSEVVVGPPAYAANFIKEQEYVDIKYAWDGTKYTAMVIYSG